MLHIWFFLLHLVGLGLWLSRRACVCVFSLEDEASDEPPPLPTQPPPSSPPAAPDTTASAVLNDRHNVAEPHDYFYDDEDLGENLK